MDGAHAPKPPTRRGDGVVVMGIPKLFRWLVDLYPAVQQRVSETLGTETAKVRGWVGGRACAAQHTYAVRCGVFCYLWTYRRK